MAVIVPFQDLVRARRREHERQLSERCVEIIELNLRFSLEMFGQAAEHERAAYAKRVRQLSELLEYVVQRL